MVYVIKVCWHIPLLCVPWKTPGDGQRNCPKHVEFYSKNKFEKLVHLVGCTYYKNISRCTVTWTSKSSHLHHITLQKPHHQYQGAVWHCCLNLFAFEVINEEAPANTSERHKVTSAFISNRNMTGGDSLNKNQYGQGEATLTNYGRCVHKFITISMTYQCAYL